MSDLESLKLLEEKRTELIQIALNRGISDPMVIELSKELDHLIYLIQSTKSRMSS